MDDDQLPQKPTNNYKTTPSGGNGGGESGKRTRTGSSDGDDETLFNMIIKALRHLERSTGKVPNLSMLTAETGIPLSKIRQILENFLSNDTTKGNTELEFSLKELLIGECDLPVETGLITPEQWTQIQIERERTGEPISLILARFGIASENQIKNALELQYGVSYIPLAKLESPEADCLKLIPERLMRELKIVPILKEDKHVTIAMVNPNNLVALDEIKKLLKGMRIKISVCTEADFDHFMSTKMD